MLKLSTEKNIALSAAEEQSLFHTLYMNKNDLKLVKEVRDQIISANIGLVYMEAKKYKNKGVIFEDLVQEGVLGLIKAIEKFDVKRGNRFSTYAMYWIKDSIIKTFKEKTIKLSDHQRNIVKKIKNIQRENFALYGEELTDKELSNILNIEVTEIDRLISVSQEPQSIFSQQDEDYNDSVLIDPNSNIADSAMMQDDLKKAIMHAMSSLSEIEQAIIAMNFGLTKDETERSFFEIASIVKTSEENVKRIVANALKKIKGSSSVKELEGFIY